MSSHRSQCNSVPGKPHEIGIANSHCSNNNIIPGLIRLDSTGEVTSAGQISNCQSPRGETEFSNCTNGRKYRADSYRNIVGNFKMDLLNSASACLGSARNYIESFYPCKTSKGLRRSKSDCSSLEHLQNMFSKKSKSFDITDHQTALEPRPFCMNSNSVKMKQETENSLKWDGNIFGAMMDTVKNIEKYVPPQRRCVHTKTNKIAAVIDPKLTPYNARLLEKSKRTHSNTVYKNNCVHELRSNEYSPEMCKGKLEKSDQDSDVSLSEKSNLMSMQQVEKKQLQNETVRKVPSASESSIIISDINVPYSDNETDKPVESVKETDWFEYECDSAKCIPISVEKIQRVTEKCAIKDYVCESKVQHLHSWLSVENGNEDVSCESSTEASDNSSQNTKPYDKGISCLQEERDRGVDDKCDAALKGNSDELSEVHNAEDFSQKTESLGYSGTDVSHPESDNNNYSVLYIRSLGKKRRPSAKKRRRHKAQQKENIDQKPTSTCSDTSSSTQKLQSQSVAFILGYDGDPKSSTPSFHLPCDMDFDSDWSESDFESDENLSSLDDENLLANELGFQCNDLLQNMHVMICGGQSADSSTQTSSSSELDEINMSWREQVSVKPESHKNKSSKKVHFADDSDLTAVHPIIAWSYAYQAARKGPWEQYALDRGRFLRRITDAEKVLEPVLSQNHRDKVFRERFCDS